MLSLPVDTTRTRGENSAPKDPASFPFTTTTRDPRRDTQLFGLYDASGDADAPSPPPLRQTSLVAAPVMFKRISTERLKRPMSLQVPMSDPFRPESTTILAPMTPGIALALSPPPSAAAPSNFCHSRRRSSTRSWASYEPPGEERDAASPSSSMCGILVTPQPAARILVQKRSTLAPIHAGHQHHQGRHDYWLSLPQTPYSPVAGHMDTPTVLGARNLEGIVTFDCPLSGTATAAAHLIHFPLLNDTPMAVPPALQAALPPLTYASILREFNTLYVRYRWHMRVHMFFHVFSTANTLIAAALLVFAADLRASALPLMLMYLLFAVLFVGVSAFNLTVSHLALGTAACHSRRQPAQLPPAQVHPEPGPAQLSPVHCVPISPWPPKAEGFAWHW